MHDPAANPVLRRAREASPAPRLAAGLRLGAWACVTLIGVLSLLPAEEMIRTGFSGYVEHAAAYGGTALLVGLGYGRRAMLGVTLLLVAYAGALELLQHFSPGRHPSVAGWLSGAVGAAFGSAGAALARRSAWLRPGDGDAGA